MENKEELELLRQYFKLWENIDFEVEMDRHVELSNQILEVQKQNKMKNKIKDLNDFLNHLGFSNKIQDFNEILKQLGYEQ
tara:strand:+ start:28 stop:267 length:240 start_codon:yes stop_codon:yes gene_type:complete